MGECALGSMALCRNQSTPVSGNYDGGIDDDRVTSLTRGPEPLQERFDTREEHDARIVGYLKSLQDRGEPLRSVCVVARTQRERDAVAEAVEREDLPVFRLESDTLDDAVTEGVRCATMHRVKGLEFDRVVLASANADLIPLPRAIDNTGDGVEREAAETAERALVHVAPPTRRRSCWCSASARRAPSSVRHAAVAPSPDAASVGSYLLDVGAGEILALE